LILLLVGPILGLWLVLLQSSLQSLFVGLLFLDFVLGLLLDSLTQCLLIFLCFSLVLNILLLFFLEFLSFLYDFLLSFANIIGDLFPSVAGPWGNLHDILGKILDLLLSPFNVGLSQLLLFFNFGLPFLLLFFFLQLLEFCLVNDSKEINDEVVHGRGSDSAEDFEETVELILGWVFLNKFIDVVLVVVCAWHFLNTECNQIFNGLSIFTSSDLLSFFLGNFFLSL